MTDTVRQFTVEADDDGVRLDRWFKRHLPQVSFAMVSRWARTGQIRVDGKRAGVEDRLAKGQVLRVPPGGASAERTPRARKPLTEEQLAMADAMLIHRDRAALVLNKPPGLATQGGSGTYEHVDGLLDAFAGEGTRPRLVHRLDKDTSGVLLVAATPGSAAYFSKRFSTRSARKIYWALVAGVPSIDEGLIDLPLAKQPGTGGEKMMVDKSEHGQPSKSRYRVIDRAGNRCAWVELQPLTGRTHQLRVHMAAIGHPIIGDGKYGGPEAFLSGSISRKMHLHARRLIIDHPDGAPLDVTAELPPHFAASLAQLGFEEADGEAVIEAPVRAPKDEEKAAAKAHAKQYRKERRGERKGRKSGERAPAGRAGSRDEAPKKRGPKKGKGSPVPAAKAPARRTAPARPKGPAKPGGAPRKPR
ncbi:RluA family pseudouridine synthase [Novosphingobium sp. TH158]|uniref:RluA family pseudouridine synthase n=1 Tax=Novosphingobium sp. TH158 TaxID=2067455 RepID=UPI000C7BE233|nr:RluA family pseudouridine synthase [Novosphingobium sp. TH158]PLK26486.1 RNA pseudouridine synthase [Novosphingobium sp. TH158]